MGQGRDSKHYKHRSKNLTGRMSVSFIEIQASVAAEDQNEKNR